MPAPQSEQPQRIDPPRSAPVDGDFTRQARIGNKDPNRVYCLANPNDFETGVPEMESQGWIVETKRKGGPTVIGCTASDGSALTVGGQILMSRSREAQQRYEEEKVRMSSLRSQAIGQKGGIDAVVNRATGRAAYVQENETNERVA